MGRNDEETPPPLTEPPSTAELTELARRLAVAAPELLPVFLCSLCRSPRLTRACRALEPGGADLAALRTDPVGARLIAASRKGAAWMRRWSRTEEALDELLPPLPADRPPEND